MFESKISKTNKQHDLLPLTPSLGKSLLLKSPVSVILEGRGVGGEGGCEDGESGCRGMRPEVAEGVLRPFNFT